MTDLNLMATNIQTLLQGAAGIKQAFDHEPDKISNLPAATLFFDGFSQSDRASRRKTVNWRWIIRIYVPLRTSDIKKPQTDLRNLVQNTIQNLRTDPSLGGSCLYHTISSGEISALLDQNNPLLLAELTLEATTEEDF